MNRVKLIVKNNRIAIDLGEFGFFYPKEEPKKIYKWMQTKVRIKGLWEQGGENKEGYLEYYLKSEGVEIPKDILSFEILDTDFNSIVGGVLIIK
ncbi:MAG: hypothetical protein DRI33_03250 [Caldiserica bacterium]|nr:MAG: hypothetical protein DRI33_03250 [Caldisericota bacterium]